MIYKHTPPRRTGVVVQILSLTVHADFQFPRVLARCRLVKYIMARLFDEGTRF